MTRAEFMARLRQGLFGLPMATAAEIAADYDLHFTDGLAAGKNGSQGNLVDIARCARTHEFQRGWRQEHVADLMFGDKVEGFVCIKFNKAHCH